MARRREPIVGRGRRGAAVRVALILLIGLAPWMSVSAAQAADTTEPVTSAGGGVVGGLPTVVLVSGPGGTVLSSVEMTGGTGPAWTCRYVNPGALVRPGDFGVEDPVAGKPYVFTCRADGELVYFTHLVYDPANPLGPALVAQRAAQIAYAQLVLPEPAIATSPPAGGDQVVGVRTWLWLDNWGPQSASATLGGVTATVTATPTQVRFDPGDSTTGDPDTVVCTDPTTAYDPTRAPAEQTTDCFWVYQRRSTTTDPAGTYPLTATVTYTITWTATNGQTGTLPTQATTTTTRPVRVIEIQPIINR